jgi:3-hydroxy-9,10-secoandrosta-1,3,5(10)-triene-9,17-dione monooxygenase reductase component
MRRSGPATDDDGVVTIHRDDPFLPPEPDRSPLRRLRARLVAPVTLWTAGTSADRAGLTVASALVAEGDPGHLLGLVDGESDLWAAVESTGRLVMLPLRLPDRHLADVFGGVAPAPGGAFGVATWRETEWGPLLGDATTWCGARLASAREVGYALLVDAVIEHLEIGPDAAPLGHYRGRYRGVADTTGA